MSRGNILFREGGRPIAPAKITASIATFGDAYSDATSDIIRDSASLDEDGAVFVRCALRILSSFGMTRSGVFHAGGAEALQECWREIGASLVDIRASVDASGLSRDRYVLQLVDHERKAIIEEVWLLMKRILPFTMGKTSYGLVGASKILFSVLPEITLPIDNAQWLYVFKTVDLSDVLQWMVIDIQEWESITGKKLNTLDASARLSTIPSVYNVVAMAARPKTLEST
jgi:hypothetical protein